VRPFVVCRIMMALTVKRTFVTVTLEIDGKAGSARRRSRSECGCSRSFADVTALHVDAEQPRTSKPQHRRGLSNSSVSTLALDDPLLSDSSSDSEAASGSQVPKTVNLAEEFERAGGVVPGQATTLMLRSLPPRLGQSALMVELARLGFEGAYNFLYVPLNLRIMKNMGYAFVNFLDADLANRFLTILETGEIYRRNGKLGKQICASVAHLQGLEANLKHYENSAVSQSRFKQRRPVVLPQLLSSIQ